MTWGLLRAVRDRIEANCQPRGILYPWWVPVASFGGQLACVVLALALRDAFWTPDPLLLTIPLVLMAPVVQLGFGYWLPWWLDCLPALVAAGWMLSVAPDLDRTPIDAVPGLLAFVTAEITARDGLRPGIAVWGISYAILGAAVVFGPGIVGFPVHAILLEVGFVVGAMLLWQMRALVAEREARNATWQQATTAERERIAREIHDLVAHSLSVTLLHITGARHALRDVATGAATADDAVGEADAALSDAEQVGRRAMADIRRTVSGMTDGAANRQALPGAADIAALVREVDQAGLHVEYDERGDLTQLADATGLGLYRIAQESLANVAKHAPGSTAHVSLTVGRGSARLVVRNELNGSRARRADGLGSGLAGMHARAAQLGAALTAGPEGDDWLVDVRLGQRGIELPCGHTVPGLGRLAGTVPNATTAPTLPTAPTGATS
ncbi:sensor histidine kinase [Nocardioides bizhenqiangii]|uniref:histidine kinase n=1 Tax=Nocardioides bizhenqiangii TaxID=3095076 RepID=A0ABZ0ZSC5_9ACTN|nr:MULTISPECIES: histidine kinase [unclassified Nocardioides]MDZ5619291.1 histidine kinase [Nocardioides sp. HM23]WQQ26686.1 histidine kinase [Nocardioides sp. HM61]